MLAKLGKSPAANQDYFCDFAAKLTKNNKKWPKTG
jgi:hypothetical protein